MNDKDRIKSDAYRYINSLTDDEFVKLLQDAGVEVVEGDGQIIFTDENDE